MEIFNQIKEGNKEAFDSVFRNHYKDLCMFANKYILDLSQCEDIVQEIFIKLWNNRKSTLINSSLKSFLYTSVRNSCIDYIRKQIKLKTVDIDNIPDVEFDVTEPVSPEIIDGIRNAISSLPQKCQTIFKLSREAGMSHKEISEELGVSTKTVENQIGIALKKIRIFLKENNSIWIFGLFLNS